MKVGDFACVFVRLTRAALPIFIRRGALTSSMTGMTASLQSRISDLEAAHQRTEAQLAALKVSGWDGWIGGGRFPALMDVSQRTALSSALCRFPNSEEQ
jgi:hypothetical protein